MINDMETKDYVLLYNQLYGDENTFTVGEKDFFEFVKRANRDLTAKERYEILTETINKIKQRR